MSMQMPFPITDNLSLLVSADWFNDSGQPEIEAQIRSEAQELSISLYSISNRSWSGSWSRSKSWSRSRSGSNQL